MAKCDSQLPKYHRPKTAAEFFNARNLRIGASGRLEFEPRSCSHILTYMSIESDICRIIY